MTNEEYVQYWIKIAEDDYASMRRIFALGEYVWALFVGHLVIEKLLKACVAGKMGNDVPKTHSLLYLAELAGIETTESQKVTMSRLVQFCTRVRYPDFKAELRRTATCEYTTERMKEIEEMRTWLLQKLPRQLNT